MGTQDLIDLFYEAALLPDRWPSALSALTRQFDGSCAVAIARGPDGVRYATSTGDDHIVRDYLDGGWEARSDKIKRCLRLNPRSFITEADIYTREELLADPALEGFYLPRGIGSEFGTMFNMPTGDLMVVSVQRRFESIRPDSGGLTAAETLRPHLARAALISARLGLDRPRGAVESLALLGIPAASLSAKGRTIVCNACFAELIPTVLREMRGRLRLAGREADLALEQSLEGFQAGFGSAVCRSIPIAASPGGTPLVAHLVPVAGAGREVFVGAACLILITRVSPVSLPDATLLSALFGLTPAEVRVARAIFSLGGIPAAAEQLMLSRETVRSQLRAVLRKTGATSQQGLTALLASMGSSFPVQGER